MQSGCVICFDSFVASSDANHDEVSIVSTMCGHVFHNICLKEWLKRSRTCPECRTPVRKENLFKLFMNFCVDAKSDKRAEESLDALTLQLCAKDSECMEKDKKIKELQTSVACTELLSLVKDEQIKDLQTICSRSKLEILANAKKIEELHTSVACTELESLVKNEKIKDMQASLSRSELESYMKDVKIAELQSCFVRSKRDAEDMRQHQMKLNNEISQMKGEVNSFETKNITLMHAMNKILRDGQDLESELQHLNTVEMIVKGCFIDIQKILSDEQMHLSNEEGQEAPFRIALCCSSITQAVVRLVENMTLLQNELTKVNQELAHSKENRTYLQNELAKVKIALSKEEKPQLPIELKLVKRKMTAPQLDSAKRIRQLNVVDNLNSSSIGLSCSPSVKPVVPSVQNDNSSQCHNLAKSTLACSPSRDGSSNKIKVLHLLLNIQNINEGKSVF